MDLRDLPPRKDPRGGSPKTPSGGIPISEYQGVISNGSAASWRASTFILLGLLGGMAVAWVTAIMSHGVTEKEMQEYVRQSQSDQEKQGMTQQARAEMHEYVDKYSPWVIDKQVVITRLATQDQNIGELRAKIDLAAKYIEQQKK